MQLRPQNIQVTITLNDEDMKSPADVAYLFQRMANAFDGPSWPVFEKLFDSRGKCVGRIELRYVHASETKTGRKESAL